MGCFNMTGFFSHLPITAGDDIVMFVYADQSSICTKDDCPISIVGKGLTPIAPPFFGKYNDYGGIEDIVDDVNHQLFTKRIGMTLDKFVNIMHDLAGVSIKQLQDGLYDMENNENAETNRYHHKTVEDYRKLLEIYEKLFTCEEYEIKVDQEYEARMNAYARKKYEATCMFLGMEHRSVYDKLVELGREHYNDYAYLGRRITPEVAFDNTANALNVFREVLGDKYKGVNPLKVGIELESVDLAMTILDNEISQEDLLKLTKVETDLLQMENYLGIKLCLHDTVFCDRIDHALYDKFTDDITPYKDIMVNYAYFISAYSSTCTTFDVSPYHHQTVHYDLLIPLYEAILDTLKKSSNRREI